MAKNEDNDKPKRHTLQSLFNLYCNYVTKIKHMDTKVYDSILLSQIDAWFAQAKLLRTTFSLTDTGLAYMKFRKWRLDFEEFQDYLELLSRAKGIPLEKIKSTLLEAGLPAGNIKSIIFPR